MRETICIVSLIKFWHFNFGKMRVKRVCLGLGMAARGKGGGSGQGREGWAHFLKKEKLEPQRKERKTQCFVCKRQFEADSSSPFSSQLSLSPFLFCFSNFHFCFSIPIISLFASKFF
ncbi:unnamed protein product [Citrullus colocynthis]|uniref:Uncharacterized protein n=1 Tax=Citrullus colocynthis TaxID=252529 RepID=A0ABP0XVL2_9ROSI